MAPIAKSIAVAGALFAALGFAAPVNKREDVVVWETVTDVVWTTVDVTTTIYPGHGHTNAVKTTVVPVATIVPSSSASSSSSSSSSSAQETPVAAQSTFQTSAAQPTTVADPPATATAAPQTTVAPQVTQEAAAPEVTTSSTTSDVQPTTSSSTTSVAANTAAAVSSSGYSGACSEASPCDGDATYYDTATSASAPSACGTTNDGLTEPVLALPHGIMTDSDCGKTVTITYGGVTASGTVVDKCMGCDNQSVDLSRFFFGKFASLDAGRLTGVKWYIN